MDLTSKLVLAARALAYTFFIAVLGASFLWGVLPKGTDPFITGVVYLIRVGITVYLAWLAREAYRDITGRIRHDREFKAWWDATQAKYKAKYDAHEQGDAK